jgi:hypothetical protein
MNELERLNRQWSDTEEAIHELVARKSFFNSRGVPISTAELIAMNQEIERLKAKLQEIEGQQLQKLEKEGNPAENLGVSKKRTQEIQTVRRHPLESIIALAKREAVDADSYQSVYAALVKLAESEGPPAPFLGHVEGEGIKYQGANRIEFFTRDALRKHMERTAKKIGQ